MTTLATYGPWALIAGGSEGVGAVHIASGKADDVAHRNDPDRAKVVTDTHRFMQRLIGE